MRKKKISLTWHHDVGWVNAYSWYFYEVTRHNFLNKTPSVYLYVLFHVKSVETLRRMKAATPTSLNRPIKASAVLLKSQVFFISAWSTKSTFTDCLVSPPSVKAENNKYSVCLFVCVIALQIHHREKRRDTQTSGVWHQYVYQHPKARSGRTDWWGLRAS